MSESCRYCGGSGIYPSAATPARAVYHVPVYPKAAVSAAPDVEKLIACVPVLGRPSCMTWSEWAMEAIAMLRSLSERNSRWEQEYSAVHTAGKAAHELAQRSTRRLTEIAEPGFIGAFAARDAAIERALAAEALAQHRGERAAEYKRLSGDYYTLYRDALDRADTLSAERDALAAAMLSEGAEVSGSFDEPCSADAARRALAPAAQEPKT